MKHDDEACDAYVEAAHIFLSITDASTKRIWLENVAHVKGTSWRGYVFVTLICDSNDDTDQGRRFAFHVTGVDLPKAAREAASSAVDLAAGDMMEFLESEVKVRNVNRPYRAMQGLVSSDDGDDEEGDVSRET